jgi:hypothetical protein
MTRHSVAALALALVASLAASARAQATKEATAVLDKAIKAMGGEEKLGKAKAVSWKGKGKLSFGGNENPFTSETTLQGLDHMRSAFEADFMGNEFKAVTVVAGDKGWRRFGDMKMDMDKDSLDNEKRMMYLQVIPATLVPLRQKEFKVEAGAVENVEGKPAVSLKVTGPGSKDFTLFFDQASGLPVKQVAKVIGFMGEEFTQETTYGNYKDFDGIKKATKLENKRDGERFIEYEISEFKALEKVEPSTFKEPE